MWTSHLVLKMYMDGEVRERIAEAQRGYEVRRTRRLRDLLGAVRRVQGELEIAEHPRLSGSRLDRTGADAQLITWMLSRRTNRS